MFFIPQVPENNCEQRLPLKKRQYHNPTPSVANNSHHHHHHHHHHPLHSKTKIRNETDVPKSGMKSPDVSKSRPPLSPKPKTTSSAPTLASAASMTPVTSSPRDADKPPVLEEAIKISKDADTSTKSASTASPQPSSETSTSTIVNKLQTSSSNQPQLITPLPSESTTSSTLSTSSKQPPAGVFEPTRKLPSTSTKEKKNRIDDVLSRLTKLKEKWKDRESPTSALIEKIGGSRIEATESSAVPEKRVLRSKRSSSEKDLMLVKKNKLTATVSVRLHKLSNSELINSNNSATLSPAATKVPKEEAELETSADVKTPTTTEVAPTLEKVAVAIKEEEKPKLKRRKTRNRTGFPVKKKRKLKKDPVTAGGTFDGDIQVKVEESSSVTEADAAETTLDDCPPIVKDESVSPPIQHDDWSDDDIPLARRLAPVLQPIVDAATPKTETSTPEEEKPVPDEVRSVKSSSGKASAVTAMPVTSTPSTEKSKIDGSSLKTLPSRASIRIHCKKQIQEEEEEAAKKEAEKQNAAKKSSAKEKEPTEKRELRPQKPATDKKPPVLKKEETKKVTDKKETKGKASSEVETKVEGEAEKDSKPKEETDKEEMR